MTPDEKKELARRVSPLSYSFSEIKEIAELFIIVVGTMVFLAVSLWLIVAWLIRLISGVDVGWSHPHGPKVCYTIAILVAAYAAKEVFRVGRPNPEYRRRLLRDIDNGIVEVEACELTEVKVFEEPEHGGLMYFLHTTDNRVYVSFDYESQDLGVAGEDPMASSFKPKRKLNIHRTPISRTVLVEEFEGDDLDIPEPLVITTQPEAWPDFEDFVDISWNGLEKKYAG